VKGNLFDDIPASASQDDARAPTPSGRSVIEPSERADGSSSESNMIARSGEQVGERVGGSSSESAGPSSGLRTIARSAEEAPSGLSMIARSGGEVGERAGGSSSESAGPPESSGLSMIARSGEEASSESAGPPESSGLSMIARSAEEDALKDAALVLRAWEFRFKKRPAAHAEDEPSPKRVCRKSSKGV
jgi:hypothetical protein